MSHTTKKIHFFKRLLIETAAGERLERDLRETRKRLEGDYRETGERLERDWRETT